MEKAVGYIRVSGKGQVEGDGFVRQETAIREFCKAQGSELVRIYREEGVSGTVEHRPALASLMVDLEENGEGIKTVVIERVDRLARDLMVQEAILADFRKQGIALVSTKDWDLMNDDPTRKLVRQVLGAIAEYDKTMTVLKLRAARERMRRKTGKCEGRKGYREAAPGVLEEVRRLHRKPKGKPRMTSALIADTLNQSGHLTLTGRAFTPENVRAILSRS